MSRKGYPTERGSVAVGCVQVERGARPAQIGGAKSPDFTSGRRSGQRGGRGGARPGGAAGKTPQAAMPPTDFDGSGIRALLASARSGAPSVSTVQPALHAVGATRTCIDLLHPKKNQFWWRGTTDGEWLSHKLFRDGHKRPDPSEPCAALKRFGASTALPDDVGALRGAARRKAHESLALPPASGKDLWPASHADEALRKAAGRLPRLPNGTHFVLRRRLTARRGSLLSLGSRANLDVNRFECPEHRALVGCSGPPFDAPFLGAFGPGGADDEWSDVVPAAPPFKYCKSIGRERASALNSAGMEGPRRVPGVAVLLPELHANINIGHAVKDLVFLAHMLIEHAR
jgi:hypothetical protein